MRSHPLSAAAAIALLGAGLSGCSGSGGAPPEQGGARIGTPVRLADCTDWRRADVRERFGTIRDLRDFAGGPVGSPAGHGATLDDDKAYKLFQNYCREDFALHFKLYKLYTRAAAFGAH